MGEYSNGNHERPVVFGSLNSRPTQVSQLPVPDNAAKLRIGRSYGGKLNTIYFTMSNVGIVDRDRSVFTTGSAGEMPILVVNRDVARLVKVYEMILVPDGNAATVFVKEELAVKPNKSLKRLARRLYEFADSQGLVKS